MVVFPFESFFAYSFVIEVILAFLFYILFVSIVVDFTSGFYKLNEIIDFASVLNKFIFNEIFKLFLIRVNKSLLTLLYFGKVSLKILNVSDC